jgi:hypothetical protein
MTDPSIRAITARFEASREAYRAARDQFQEQQAAQLADLEQRKAGARQDQAVWMRAFAEAKAADQAKEQADADRQNRWPGRDKKERVLSFSEDEPSAPPPPPVAPRPKVPEPQPIAAERPQERGVLSFGEDDEQPDPPPPPAPKPQPRMPEPQPSASDRPRKERKDRVLSFSTDDEEEGFQGFRRPR